MFVNARALVLAFLAPSLTEDEKRRKRYLRSYGNDFTPDRKDPSLQGMADDRLGNTIKR